MPLYQYRNEETGDIKEVFQKMNDKHEYSEGGIAWKRVFTSPNAAIDSIGGDNFSKESFLKRTNKAGTVGDMWDLSAEMAENRERKGVDRGKGEAFDEYKKRVGKKHLLDRKTKIENNFVEVTL